MDFDQEFEDYLVELEEFVTIHLGPVSGFTNNPLLNTWEKYFSETNPTNLAGWMIRYEKDVLKKEPAVRFINRKKNESRAINN